MGRASNAVWLSKFPRFRYGQQPKLREMFLVKLSILVVMFCFFRSLEISRNAGRGTMLELKFNSIRFPNSNPVFVTHQSLPGAR